MTYMQQEAAQAAAGLKAMDPGEVQRQQLLALEKIRTYTKATAALLGLMLIVGFIAAIVMFVLVTGAGQGY